MLYVNLYLEDRAYGGPEEGGWWYDVGQAVKSFPVATRRRAKRIANMVQKIADCRNKDGANRDLNSVNCVGRYTVYIEDAAATNFPSVIPHYE